MSKSKKKQAARKRAAEAPPLEGPTTAVPSSEEEPSLALPVRKAMPLDQALYDRVVAAATKAGQMREEGDRLTWIYNGDAVAMKYTEPDEAGPAKILVAAFRQGVVFQVEGETQVVYQPGPWELELDKLEPAPDEDEDLEAE